MSDEIIKVLDDLSDRFGVAIDWTSQNVLPYLQELCDKYINYEIWTSVLYVIICLIIISLMTYWIKKGLKNDYNDTFFVTLGGIAICSLIIMICQIIDIITALTFPEKLIYEYISYIASTH